MKHWKDKRDFKARVQEWAGKLDVDVTAVEASSASDSDAKGRGSCQRLLIKLSAAESHKAHTDRASAAKAFQAATRSAHGD